MNSRSEDQEKEEKSSVEKCAEYERGQWLMLFYASSCLNVLW